MDKRCLLLTGLLCILFNTEILASDVLECGETIFEDTTLASDIGPCDDTGLILGADDITLNCNNYSITGPGRKQDVLGVRGILLENIEGATIENCYVTNYNFGIFLNGSSRNKLLHNMIINVDNAYNLKNGSSRNILKYNSAKDGGTGFEILFDSSSNKLIQNVALNLSGTGFFIENSSDKNILRKNKSNNNWNGFFIENSHDNKLFNNEAVGNGLVGFILVESSNNFLKKNLAIGNNTVADPSSGGIHVSGSNNVFKKNTANDNIGFGFGFDLYTHSNILIKNEACGNTLIDAELPSANLLKKNDFCTINIF